VEWTVRHDWTNRIKQFGGCHRGYHPLRISISDVILDTEAADQAQI
jgi:hypothetical protein